MTTLQMNSVRSQVAKFQRHLLTQTFLDRRTPLLNVLRRRIGFNSSKAHRGHAQNCRCEVEVSCHNASRWDEVIALLCLGKHVRNIVTLIAPGVHVYRRKEDAKCGM